MRLVLASMSPRRRELLAMIAPEFEVVPSHVDEEEIVARVRPGHPEEMVMLLAEAKAREVARTMVEASVVIGADTIVWLDGEALNKPRDEDDAVRMLLSLSGRVHRVYTGVAVVEAGECALRPAVTSHEMTEVEFRPITADEARAYVATGEPMDKAGGYGIQDSGIGGMFVRAIRGDYFNVVGLPLGRLREMLAGIGAVPVQPEIGDAR